MNRIAAVQPDYAGALGLARIHAEYRAATLKLQKEALEAINAQTLQLIRSSSIADPAIANHLDVVA